MTLDLTSLTKAVNLLENALQVATDENLSAMPEGHRDVVKAGVIQNFEFTYELCWKFMKRWLKENLGRSYVDGIPRRELFRLSFESKLISDVDKWMQYHDARNETSHTYDQDTADEIFKISKTFLSAGQNLLENLEIKND